VADPQAIEAGFIFLCYPQNSFSRVDFPLGGGTFVERPFLSSVRGPQIQAFKHLFIGYHFYGQGRRTKVTGQFRGRRLQ